MPKSIWCQVSFQQTVQSCEMFWLEVLRLPTAALSREPTCTSGQLRHPRYRFRSGLCFARQLASCVHVVTGSRKVHLVRSTGQGFRMS